MLRYAGTLDKLRIDHVVIVIIHMGCHITELVLYFQAHALYNSAAVRDTEPCLWKTQVFETQCEYWKQEVQIDQDENQRITSELCSHLKETRASCSDYLNALSESDVMSKLTSDEESDGTEVFSSHIQQLSIRCTDRMLDLSSMVMRNAVTILDTPVPCGFSAVAIGSLAKAEATPYSDLEFMFILEKKDDAINRYFEKLAVTAYFLIGNLGETKLSHMAIDELDGWFSDTCINGFKIDSLSNGAGNIPTGNGTTNPPNHFILTVDELIQKYKETLDNPVDGEAQQGDFSAMLTYTKVFYSHGQRAHNLLQEFRKFQQMVQPNKARQIANEEMFMADVIKYGFQPNKAVANKGYVVNSKKDLYRYPTILLFNITILTGIKMDNSWDTLNALHNQRIISTSLYTCLRFLLACACYFRLSSYLYYNSHDDRTSVLQETSSVTKIRKRPGVSSPCDRWYIPLCIFSAHCEHMIPIKRHFSGFEGNILHHLKVDITGKTWHCKFLTLHFCHRSKEVWNLLVEKFSQQILLHQQDVVLAELGSLELLPSEIWQSVSGLIYALYKKREYESALQYLLQTKKYIESHSTDSLQCRLITAEILDETANCNIFMHKHHDAEISYSKALHMRATVLKGNDMLLGASNYYLGRCLRIQKKLHEAKTHLLQALNIFHYHASRDTLYNYRGEEIAKTQPIDTDFSQLPAGKVPQYLNHPSPQIGHTLWNLASIYGNLFYLRLAHEYHVKALDTYLRTYGNCAIHQDIVDALFDMGNSSSALGNGVHADFYYCKALEMVAKMFSSVQKSVYAEMGRPLESDPHDHIVCEERCRKTVDAFQRIPGYNVAHPQSANILRRYGQHMINLGNHTLATIALGKALEMYKQCFGEEGPCFDILSTQAYIGEKLWKEGNHQAGLSMCYEAVRGLTCLGDVVALMRTADIHHRLGLLYLDAGNTATAKMQLETASTIFLETSGDSKHPMVVEIDNKLKEISNTK